MYKNEITKLACGLIEKGIAFEFKPIWDGWQIMTDEWDAVCHSYSYGHENGLLEIMGSIVTPNEDEGVEGCLTAEDILARV